MAKNPTKLRLHIPASSGGTHCQPLLASRAGVPASPYGVATRESILRILITPGFLRAINLMACGRGPFILAFNKIA